MFCLVGTFRAPSFCQQATEAGEEGTELAIDEHAYRLLWNSGGCRAGRSSEGAITTTATLGKNKEEATNGNKQIEAAMNKQLCQRLNKGVGRLCMHIVCYFWIEVSTVFDAQQDVILLLGITTSQEATPKVKTKHKKNAKEVKSGVISYANTWYCCIYSVHTDQSIPHANIRASQR